MKGVETIDQPALLVSANEQGNFRVFHGLARESRHIVYRIFRWIKVVVDGLIQKAADTLLCNHILQRRRITTAKVLHNEQLGQLLIHRHTRYYALYFCLLQRERVLRVPIVPISRYKDHRAPGLRGRRGRKQSIRGISTVKDTGATRQKKQEQDTGRLHPIY